MNNNMNNPKIIDYQKVILELLQNNTISSPPPKEVLDLSEDIALAVWQNFDTGRDYYDSFDVYDWYNNGNWKHMLSHYKENIGFWEKALNMKSYKDQILIATNFRNDFPIIAEHFLGTEEKLVALFNETNNIDFFHMLRDVGVSEEKKEKIYKKYLIEHSYKCNRENVQKYAHDTNFIKSLLQKSPSHYRMLSEEDKNNDEYIKIVLTLNDILLSLPQDKRKEFFSQWLSHQPNNITPSIFKRLNHEEQVQVMQVNRLIAINIIEHQTDYYKKVIKSFCKTNLEMGLNYIPNKYISTIYDNEMKQNCFDILEKYVDSYDSINGFTNADMNKIMLISSFPALNKKLHQNKTFLLNERCYYDNTKRIDKKDFEEMFNMLEEKYNNHQMSYEECESKLNKLKSRMNVGYLKQVRYPGKNLFKYLIQLKLTEKLSDNLDEKETSANRLKL